ncbi:MAG: 50S ribosomal protein L22 [Planctomycetota bacterium]
MSRVVSHRGSPKKAKLVVDLVRGKPFSEAENLLRFSTKRAAENVFKALQAARAEAEETGADESRLIVSEARIDGAKHIKRFQPKDRGRAHPILKRQSHITVGVQEKG